MLKQCIKPVLIGMMVFLFACGGGPSDEQLQKDIAAAISTAYPNVSFTVKDKAVTLSGSCPDASCKSSAETATKAVKGVKSVVNNIEVTPPAVVNPAPSPEITATDSLQTSLSSLLAAYKGVSGTVENGVITLTGEIKRSQLKTLMQSVQELKPKKVENKLVIK
jgi:hyperosmotically inducible protein